VCIELFCPSQADVAVTWAATAAGNTAVGICAAGFGGNPTRACAINGAWLLPGGTACNRMHPSAPLQGPSCPTHTGAGGAATGRQSSAAV
jgi:hypothetical protein